MGIWLALSEMQIGLLNIKAPWFLILAYDPGSVIKIPLESRNLLSCSLGHYKHFSENFWRNSLPNRWSCLDHRDAEGAQVIVIPPCATRCRC